ncbi:MAG: hypothetical protein A2504_05735 [Bdellovibrionales bacterium RIFOXYD12_FULL_39_22]|nr:MAG: hypothetical protein A2385_06090 [Bdellovibrionales bacterium RIFOXYB1_FULL_39_21]OFZ41849.1 MAG: hypothetical protein A2485_08060 [Bdellovibrionales bacterium RIFOXYC12_FULL_39_17]OFZ50565.1 MAG: hypothetical protein A2404_05010 [Bdellovibrionales bacterium RIFOXYC1_FULL_39_130]OFZ77788.1 MAG: hypothetical protein A2560_00180 [Bdellovibrionales bacterium RIFOXYD1_FULL_39_84]OFZ93776.1 MAG: hypothetical protein A2504_05735 [Bdellovibrionales bacterium RIFOXYD12_FULL_39_22]HLE11538.1 GG
MADDATVVLTDIKAALTAADSEASKKPAALLVVGGELNGTIFDLIEKEVTVGRSAENMIALDFPGISRLHFKLLQKEKEYLLEDAGSRNGTYLNNKKVDAITKLVRGDIIKIGSMALKYLPHGDPERLTYDKLNLEANTDKWTKCYNKAYFNRACEMEVKKSKVTGIPLSIIMFDLDHFKKLNDTYGHDAGDYVLQHLSQILRKHGVRDTDVLSRYGGEEFVLLLPKTNLKQAFEIAERLRKVIETEQFTYDNKVLPVTASLGVADYRQGVLSGVDLFKRADKALYLSKSNGRNQVQFYRG